MYRLVRKPLPGVFPSSSFSASYPQARRYISSTQVHLQTRRRPIPDESTLAGAQHQPSLSGPSLGHLISELSETTPQMLKDGVRTEGQTMNEGDRTFARRVALGLIGFPVAVGMVWVGVKWLTSGADE